MSESMSEAISTDDSPAPEPTDSRHTLLGDPETEGNDELVDVPRGEGDDVSEELNNSDVQF